MKLKPVLVGVGGFLRFVRRDLDNKKNDIFACVCGKEKSIQRHDVLSGKTRSCGCMKSRWMAEGNSTHGHSRVGANKNATPEYTAWGNMISRCRSKTRRGAKHYSGRGISVCVRWLKFENFLTDMGPRPGHGYSIDRINNDGNYEPKNCRWATASEQSRNRSVARMVSYRGKTMTIAELSQVSGIPYDRLYSRIHSSKMTAEVAVEKGDDKTSGVLWTLKKRTGTKN